ncbi:hypothetical protein [Streptomyces sp. NPDC092307]
MIGAWAVAYVLTLVLGFTVFLDGVACALPAAAAAWHEARAL